MQIVILAAGRGERLWPLTRNTPKNLLELTNGMSVLDMQMQALSSIPEIREIIFVLGYLAEQIEAKLQHYADKPFQIRTVYNPFFAESNNLISLWMAVPYIQNNVVVINGDDVYNSGVPRGLIEADRDQDVVMVIDRKPGYDSDDMKVISKGDRIVKVGKEIDSEAANGESIGMIRFVGSGTIRLKENLDRLVRQPVGKQIFWLRAVQDLIDQGYVVNWHECPVDAWAEIDFHPDLHLIRDTVLEHYADLVKNWEQPK